MIDLILRRRSKHYDYKIKIIVIFRNEKMFQLNLIDRSKQERPRNILLVVPLS